MGICFERPVNILLSEKDQIDFIKSISNLISELESQIDKINEEDPNTKMEKFIFILNCIKELSPFLNQIEKGRKCEERIKLLFENIFSSIKENNRNKYYSNLYALKSYFLE